MIEPGPTVDVAPITDGTIAAVNLESARLQSWSRFWQAPERPGLAETVVEQELLTAQFCGDTVALDRLDALVAALVRADPDAARTFLVAAQVACAAHRFAEARVHLAQAAAAGVSPDAVARLALTLDQATGTDLDEVLAARRRRAGPAGRWEELVPLGALLADLGAFDDADRTYRRALSDYRDGSPFALAWVCFELGMLWGEHVPAPQADVAAHWYRAAIDRLPRYVKARVHLAEILLRDGRAGEAQELLRPVAGSGDPEVSWRLADVAEAAGNPPDAEAFTKAARATFDALLAKYPLAFADHAAEFYLARGDDGERAFALARLNLANRPTLRAFEQAVAAARAAGEPDAAAALVAEAAGRWGHSAAFRHSPLAPHTGAAGAAKGARGTSLPARAQEERRHART